MSPRRASSKKWTHFPQDYIDQVTAVFKETFATSLGSSTLIVNGRIYPEELVLRVGVREVGRLKQSNFEVSTDYEADVPESLDRIHSLVDVAASMMLEFFESEGEAEFPFVWQEYPFKGQPMYLQTNSENTDLEAEANAFLGLTADSLLHDEGSTEDALDHAEKDQLH